MWKEPALPAGVRARTRPGLDVGIPRAGLFLDRDGVLVEEVGYLHKVADLRLRKGAADLVRAANRVGVPVGLVSNQSGIDRGMYGWDAWEEVEAEIDARLERHGAWLDARVACAFHPEHTRAWGAEHEYWRKPGPGMPLHAARLVGADPRLSWMVGDMASDVVAAKEAGFTGAVHVRSLHGQRDEALSQLNRGFLVHPAETLADAHQILAEHGLFR